MNANQLIVMVSPVIGTYADLANAIDMAARSMPYKPCLKDDIFPAIAASEGRSLGAVARGISREAERLWDKGDRAKLIEILGHGYANQAPPPKELILSFAYFLVYGIPYAQTESSGGNEKYPLIQNRPKHIKKWNATAQPAQRKEYLIVRAEHGLDGSVKPLTFQTASGPEIKIDAILDVQKAPASLGVQMMYTVQAEQKELHLFYDQLRWFLLSRKIEE